MKPIATFKPVFTFLLLFYFTQIFSTELYINDPQSWWNRDGCNITEATLSVKPKGIYMEYGLYLTLEPTQPYTVNDTFEIVMNFDLPKGAFIHDSWLWVDNQIVQAELLERWTAFNIYEGIVNRRKDPSILYKNSDTNYEIRIFPLAGNSSRKIKITYLVPTEFTTQSVSALLPQSILNLSATLPTLEVLAYTDSTWKDPQILGTNSAIFTYNSQTNIYNCILSAIQLNNSGISISYKSPLKNGFYIEKYATTADEGFYQFVTIPDEILTTNENKKVAFILDHQDGNYLYTKPSLLSDFKNSIYNNFSEGDSFNVIVATPYPIRMSNVWLHADSTNIENIFNQINQTFAINLSSNTDLLLINAIDFITDNNNDGSIALITNGNGLSEITQANDLVNYLKLLMQPYSIKIDVIYYQNTNFNYNPSYINNDYYYGNSFFCQKLARETGGNYFHLYEISNYYYYYEPQILYSFNNRLNEMLSMVSGKIADFDLYNSVNNGFCYGRFDITDNYSAYLKKPVVQIGKYLGSGNFETTISGRLNGSIISQTFQINNTYQSTDTLVKKMWTNAFINQLEGNASTNQIVQEIIDSSINNRVLSTYTAFLALEPNDTIKVCETCPDETSNNPNTLSLPGNTFQLEYTITAAPNPFTELVVFSITLPNDISDKKITIEIYDLLGKLIKYIDVENDNTSNILKVKWDGTDINKLRLPEGIFMAVLKTSKGTTTQKIIKQ